MKPQVTLIRHGATEWSQTGRHTGRTDVPLTAEGRAAAERLAERLDPGYYARVWTSPLRRAADTAALAGFAGADTVDDLVEWDYGNYEGVTTAQVRETRPGWDLWADGVPGGETISEVAARADRVIASLRDDDTPALVFAHGHFLRIMAARWCRLAPEVGGSLLLDPATLSVLGWERDTPALARWNG